MSKYSLNRMCKRSKEGIDNSYTSLNSPNFNLISIRAIPKASAVGESTLYAERKEQEFASSRWSFQFETTVTFFC